MFSMIKFYERKSSSSSIIISLGNVYSTISFPISLESSGVFTQKLEFNKMI